MTKTKRMPTVPASLTWHTQPVDGGQIVAVTYACDGDYLYRHAHDRSDNTHSYDRARIAARNKYDFEPWNNQLPDTCKAEPCHAPID